MSFTIKNLEYALLIFIRVTAIVSVTPLFGNNAVPVRVKAAISFFLSIIMINTVDYTAVSYVGTIGYSYYRVSYWNWLRVLPLHT